MAGVGGAGQRSGPGLSPPAPLTDAHDLSRFHCGEPALDAWLQQRARKNESRFSRTYVVCEGDRVVGYYCIAAGAVTRSEAPARLRRNAPDSIPVSVIGRLAVDSAYAGRGLGADLLADALSRIAAASQSIGIGAVMVKAKTEAAKRFYLRQAEWIAFPEDGRTLFLPVETIVAALG